MKFDQRYTTETIPKLSPAAQCFLCEMPKHVAKGRHIVATSSLGIRLATNYYYGQRGKCFYFSSQLNPSSNLYLQYWSDSTPMTPALLQRARDVLVKFNRTLFLESFHSLLATYRRYSNAVFRGCNTSCKLPHLAS